MKKIGSIAPDGERYTVLKKAIFIMKITFIILITTTFSLFATGTYSQTAKVSLHLNQVSIKQALKEIEKSSEFYFLYNDNLVNVDKIIDIEADDQQISKILGQIFDDSEIKYEVYDRQIVISPVNMPLPQEAKRTISGKVTDQSGGSLPGVSVAVKGTTMGIITDAQGKYSLSNVPENAVLIFSFIGLKSQEVGVSNKSTLNIGMQEETVGVDEVVVIGYGTQKKSNLTAAVTQVSSEVLQNRPVKTVNEALDGYVAGLNVSNANGAPESNASLNIRGFTGFNSKGSPLILVDGVERVLADVNPSDVESISVLKDAAASAIYGSRAPFGVMLITTKSGKKGDKIKVNYSGNYQIGTPIGLPEWTDSWEFAEKINEKQRNSLLVPLFTDATIQKMKDFGSGKIDYWNEALPNGQWAAHYESFANNDWFKVLFKDQVPSQQHNLNFSGGSNSTTYYMGLGYNDANGIVRGSNDKKERYTTLLKVKTDVTDWLSLYLNMNYVKTNEVGANYRGGGRNYTDIMNNAASSFPNWADLSPNGSPYWLSSGPSLRGEGGLLTNDRNETTVTGGFDLKPIKELSIKGNYTWKNFGSHYNLNSFPIISINADGTTRNSGRSVTQSAVNRQMTTSDYHTADFNATYTKQVKKHAFQAMAGYQEEYYKIIQLIGDRKDLFTNSIPTLHTAYNAQPLLDDALSHWATQGIFGRFSYNYSEKYLFEFNGRYDAHSKFPKDIRWAYFPSFSMAWNIAKEDFWKIEQINSLKLRGSITNSGDNGSGNYLYLPTMSTALGAKDVLLEGAKPNMVFMPGMVSPDLTWAKPRTLGLGLDMVALKNRLEMTFDCYQRTTYDQAGPAEVVPVTLGATPPNVNNAVSETRGWEFTTKWRDNSLKLAGKQLGYSASFNISDYIGYVVDYKQNISGSRSGTWTPGEVFGKVYVYESNGIAQNIADVEKNVPQGTTWFYPGDLMLKDINGDGRVTSGDGGYWYSMGDLVEAGYNYPRYSYGLNLEANWNGFDISLLLTGVPYWKFYSGSFYVMPIAGDVFNSKWFTAQKELGTWSPQTPDAFYPRYSSKTYSASDQYLINLAHLKVQNLRVGYQLPAGIVSKIKLDRVYIYTSIENLGYIYYKSFVKYDPEIIQNNGGGGYPPQRVFSFGINIGI